MVRTEKTVQPTKRCDSSFPAPAPPTMICWWRQILDLCCCCCRWSGTKKRPRLSLLSMAAAVLLLMMIGFQCVSITTTIQSTIERLPHPEIVATAAPTTTTTGDKGRPRRRGTNAPPNRQRRPQWNDAIRPHRSNSRLPGRRMPPPPNRGSDPDQDLRDMHAMRAALRKVFRDETHTITLADLTDLVGSDTKTPNGKQSGSWDDASVDRGPILEILASAGLNVTLPVLQRLPTWTQVVRLYGTGPVVVEPPPPSSSSSSFERGKKNEFNPTNSSTAPPPPLSMCARFRQRVPREHRFVGVAGQMNTGSNALSQYLANNVRIRSNKTDDDDSGVLWTVPWFKHGWANLRNRFRYQEFPSNHDNVMAVVLVRDPYFWMQR